jgi:hypothetical protein
MPIIKIPINRRSGILDNNDIPLVIDPGIVDIVSIGFVDVNNGRSIGIKIARPTIDNIKIGIAILIVLKLCVKKTLNDIVYKIHKTKYKYSGVVIPATK